MSNSENPSEYSLIFKRLIYGDVEPKGEPLTVLELEGNFAHLKDYINSLTSKLSDNTDSISKMSESITDLQKRVEKLEGGSPEEEYFSIEYLNTSYETLNSIQKSANEYGKANGGIDFGSIVDNPFIYHLGKREVGGNLYLGAKDGKYYPLSDINTSEFELVDDTYTVRVFNGQIVSISETNVNTTITLVDNTTSVSGNLARLYLAPDKEAKDQSLVYISETTFSETGEAVFDFDFDSVGQSEGSGDIPKGESLLEKSFVIAAYANGPQKLGQTPEPYWYDMITSDNSGYTLNRQSAKTVIFNLNVRLSNDESVESYPLYYGDTKDTVRQLLQIKGFQGQFELTNNEGDTSLELTFDQDLIIYSETFNIGEIAYDTVETTLYYDDFTDGDVYSNTFTLVEISSSTTTTTMAPNFYVNTSNEIDPSAASFEVHQLSDDKSYVNLGNIGTLESTFVSNDKGGYYDFYYRFYADPSYNYEVWINWNNGDGNQIYPAVEIISTTTTTTTLKIGSGIVSVSVNGYASFGQDYNDGTYTSVSGTSYDGIGSGALFDLVISQGEPTFTIVSPGDNYVVGEQIWLPGNQLGGTTGNNALRIIVTATTEAASGR